MKALSKQKPARRRNPPAQVGPVPNIKFQPVDHHETFMEVAQDVHKRCGAVYSNLKGLARTPIESTYLQEQLALLRSAMRELVDQARRFPCD